VEGDELEWTLNGKTTKNKVKVTATELIGWEHSMKNELIVASFKDVPRKNAQDRLEQILQELNLEEMRSRFAY
jgi:ABC-type nitrate/sulfonate/bicarbonate transport system ATPase subunit